MSGLRLAELPALFWVLLAGRESRARLRFVLASRENAARDAIRVQVGRDIEAGKRAATTGPGASGMLLQLRRSREAAALAATGAAQAYGLAAGLRAAACDNGHPDHPVLWVEGRGRVCLTCEGSESVTVSVNGTVVQVPWPR